MNSKVILRIPFIEKLKKKTQRQIILRHLILEKGF